jgi:hypothetical protein
VRRRGEGGGRGKDDSLCGSVGNQGQTLSKLWRACVVKHAEIPRTRRRKVCVDQHSRLPPKSNAQFWDLTGLQQSKAERTTQGQRAHMRSW